MFFKRGGLIVALLLLGSWTHGNPGYTGLVAARTFISGNFDAANTTAMSRSYHIARTAISSLKIVIPNWYVSSSTFLETGTGGALTVTASIEYPATVCTVVKFSGSTTGTTATATTLVSDATAVSIPNGANFWVRIFESNPSGILYYFHPDGGAGGTQQGEALNVAAHGSDQTANCASVPTACCWEPGSGVQTFPPVAIIGTTTQPSVAIIGDSIAWGGHDFTTDPSEQWGLFARPIGGAFAYMNLSQSGDKASSYASGHALRAALFQYATAVISNYGVNDLIATDSAATVLTNLQTCWATAAGKQIFQSTIGPWTSSTDNWATSGNQTLANTAMNTQRVSLNTSLRASPVGLTNGIFETADVFETSRNSGIWISQGTGLFYTDDGLHGTKNAYPLAQSSGAIDTTRLHYP